MAWGARRLGARLESLPLRVLTWNLFHGRSLPPAGRDLIEAFAQRLAGWDWDVALLQEVPPWWPAPLAVCSAAQQVTALTSRNALLPLRRALARRWPDAIKSNGGGANAVLVRGTIAAHERLMLRRRPERRVAQLVRTGAGVWVANYHATTRVALAADELERLASVALERAGSGAVVLGGDLNLREPDLAAQGFAHVAGHSVDHIFARGLRRVGELELPDRRLAEGPAAGAELSDHAPLVVALG